MSLTLTQHVETSFPFEVIKRPLYDHNGTPLPIFGLFRSDTNELVADKSVTERYTPHTKQDVAALLAAAESVFGDLTSPMSFFNKGHCISVQPSRDALMEMFKGDTLAPRLTIRAGYDGRAFEAAIGFFRIICSNLGRFRMVEGTDATIRHTSSLPNRMADLIADFSRLDKAWMNITARVEVMREKMVNIPDMVEHVFGVPDVNSRKGLTQATNRMNAIVARYTGEAQRLGITDSPARANGWMAWNAGQGFIQHDSVRHGTVDPFRRGFESMTDARVERMEAFIMAN